MPPVEAKALPDPPSDGITALSYMPDQLSSDFLLASTSWDGCLHIYDTAKRSKVVTHNMESGPLLSLATPAGGHAVCFTGGLDGSVNRYDVKTGTHDSVGRHAGSDGGDAEVGNAVSCLASVDALSGDDYTVTASAGWDSEFRVWDSRASGAAPASSARLPGKAFSMDCAGSRCVVATAGRRTCLIDLRMMTTTTDDNNNNNNENNNNDNDDETVECVVAQNRESSLKYQTRTVRFFPDATGLALGSIEGRVAIEWLDPDSRKKKYAFKCHRVDDTVHPVNCVDFHPRHYGSFATGGCDGTVVVWDAEHKKRLTALGRFPSSVAALAFNHDGTELAVASSYTFEEGERDHHPRDEIYVRPVLDHESRPKQPTGGDGAKK